MKKYIIAIALGVAGLILVISENPWIALGVFLMIWGNNISRSKKKTEDNPE